MLPHPLGWSLGSSAPTLTMVIRVETPWSLRLWSHCNSEASMSFLLPSPCPTPPSQGFRLTCRLEQSHSHSRQTNILQSHIVDGTAHLGREASSGIERGSPSRGPGHPGNSPPHPSFLPVHCILCRRPHLHLCPHILLLWGSDTGDLRSWEGRSIESLGPPA